MSVFVVNPESEIIDILDEMQTIIWCTAAMSSAAIGVDNEEGLGAHAKPVVDGYMSEISRNLDALKRLTAVAVEKWRADHHVK